MLFPQDIRSYFLTSGSTPTNSKVLKGKSKKRHVLSSDDEDDVVPSIPVSKSKSQVPEKRKIVDPIDVFGSEPAKQSAIKIQKPHKKKTVRTRYASVNNHNLGSTYHY